MFNSISKMIASQTPPNKDIDKHPPRPSVAKGQPLSIPKLPMNAGPALGGIGSSSGSSGGDLETFASRDAGLPPKIRLHPRFRNSKEDERDVALVAADKNARAANGIGGKVVRCSIKPTLAPRQASWTSWTATSTGVQPIAPTWRLQLHTNSDDKLTAAPPMATMARFQAAHANYRPREAASIMRMGEYERFRHPPSHHGSHGRHPHARPASSTHAGRSIATSHYQSWQQQWSRQTSLDLGSRNFVQQSRALAAATQVNTTTRSQPSHMQGQPQHPPHCSTLFTVSNTPPKVSAVQGQGMSTSANQWTSGNNQGVVSKHWLSPHQDQQMTPLFKKFKGFDKLDLLCSATLEIGELHDNPTGCSCPKSKCVALYCDCFKAGRRCNQTQCSCVQCKNTIAESGVDGARTKAIRSILARNPRAFRTAGEGNPLLKLPPGEIACNCIRSRCLKLYCTCFQRNLACRPGICTCVGCYNTENDREGHRKAAIEQILHKRPDAFQVKVKEKGLGCACKNNRCIKKYCCCFQSQLACTEKCTCRHCENKSV